MESGDLKPMGRAEYKQMFGGPTSYQDTLDMYLYLNNIKIDPDEIVSATGLMFHKKHKTGETIKRGTGTYTAEANYLSFKKSYPGVIVPEAEVTSFIEEFIVSHSTYWKSVFEQCQASVCVVFYYHQSNNIGLVLERKAIHYLADYGVDVNFDLYCLHEDN